MAQYWVVAADAARARIFARQKKFSPLQELETLTHPESRLHGRDLASDKPGLIFESKAYNKSYAGEPGEVKKQQAESFARRLAARLREARVQGAYQSLIVVAEAGFLGLMRKHLDAETREHIQLEIDKNVTRSSAEEIATTVDAAFG